jgi:hypothetical protein
MVQAAHCTGGETSLWVVRIISRPKTLERKNFWKQDGAPVAPPFFFLLSFHLQNHHRFDSSFDFKCRSLLPFSIVEKVNGMKFKINL